MDARRLHEDAVVVDAHNDLPVLLLLRNRELTGQRLLTQHNLAFVQRVVARLRDGVLSGDLAGVADAIRGGAAV